MGTAGPSVPWDPLGIPSWPLQGRMVGEVLIPSTPPRLRPVLASGAHALSDPELLGALTSSDQDSADVLAIGDPSAECIGLIAEDLA